MRQRPIGVFDSGFGGLTVLRELISRMPHEAFIYLGDTARVPYGSKSPETIVRYTRESCEFLMARGVKCIVIACNTSTATALDTVARHIAVPMVGVVDPTIQFLTPPLRYVGILATQATVASGVYQRKLSQRFPEVRVKAVAAPLLVSLVEEGFIDHPIASLAVQEYGSLLLAADVDTLILACTHYPLLLAPLTRLFPPDRVKIVDPARACAQATEELLKHRHLEALSPAPAPLQIYVTDDPGKFHRLGPRFLGRPIDTVQMCQI